MKWLQTPAFRRILMQFTTSYILFILIPVLVLNVAASRAIRVTEQSAMRSNMTVLRHSRSTIDLKLRAIDSLSTQVLTNQELNNLQYQQELSETSGYYPLWQAAQSFKSMIYLEDEFNIAIYYRRSDVFLTPTSISSRLAKDYGELYRFGDYTYEQFCGELHPPPFRRSFFPSMDITVNGAHSRGMLYAMPLWNQGSGPQDGATVYFILKESMMDELFTPVLESGGSYLILDAQNRLLMAGGKLGNGAAMEAELPLLEEEGLLDERFYGKENIANYLLSDYGLKLITIMPRSEVLRDVSGLRVMSVYLNLAAVLLAVGYALYLAVRNSRRLSGVLENAADSGLEGYNGENVFDYLNNAMLSLVNSNHSLRLSAERQRPILQAAFLDRLINGSFTEEAELQEMADRLNFPVSGCRYCILAISLEEEDGDSSTVEGLGQFTGKKQRALTRLERIFEGRGYIYSRSIDQVVILCTFRETESPRYRAIVEELAAAGIEELYREEGLLLRCVGGDLYQPVSGTCESYTLCRDLFLSYSFLDMQGAVLWSGTQPRQNRSLFHYPPEFESKLLRQIKLGDSSGALASVEDIIRKNFDEQPLSPGMGQLFIEQLRITLLKAAGDNGGTEAAGKKVLGLRSRTPGPALRAAVADIVRELCGASARRSGEKAENIRREIIAFVEERFRDPNLSLKYAADHFGFSEAYFSQLFKELAGENFSAYLDRLRMEHARQLLRATAMKVDEVALDSGYALASTFRRAYKRYYGVNPTAERAGK
ncbi:MAG: helix-turn-helix transcriptional regulator [Provencibacterium sp.]|jgi:two-component system response regulator YesN|nr:helix-turn-helix transcriptional regulator [Provencibacterium sp.]